MPNASEPDRSGAPKRGDPVGGRTANPGDEITDGQPLVPNDPETETVVISKPDPDDDPETNPEGQRERRFTAPGFDAKETQVITTPAEPATEVFSSPVGKVHPPIPAPPPPIAMPPKTAVPQSIPPREGSGLRAVSKRFSWGWVLAITVIVLAIAVIAIMLAVLLTRGKHAKTSQEDQVRQTIQSLGAALQRGDLQALRTLTCGTTRDGYQEYDDHKWQETYGRVSAAKQFPVIASIDQVVVNGQHAEANVTTFVANDPQVRSTRSIDLQFRDDQWKICESPTG
jgi:hypothetical protein